MMSICIFQLLRCRKLAISQTGMNMVSSVTQTSVESAIVSQIYALFQTSRLTLNLVAGRTILPSMMEGFSQIVDSSQPLKIQYQAISYKPFLSLFNMTGVTQQNPELATIGKNL